MAIHKKHLEMQNSNWEQVREIFFDALEIEEKSRERFLDNRCGADAELRGEIEELLEEHFEVDDIFDQPVFEVTKLLDENGEKRVERRFGKYKIVREIGAGGMGTVFLAERDDGEFNQKVAVKVSRQTIADKQTVRRFMFERQILASLNHPFIAQLHDGGIADDGSPFLIMEYIEGKSITDFADEHKLNIKERLELFVQVCEGVAFAHRNLIVHRDIKPSNILITANGTPKLLDFGLAKFLETNMSETVTKTATIFQALTPAYASPEQMQGKPISTASDVYSLGVVLYELLTGSRPFSFADKSLPEILQTLEHSKIVAPSEVLNRKFLKGDLDTIILKALRREPETRYGSVEKFAEDVGRHLHDLPITARPATSFYRASKFYGRNKISVLATAFIFISLIAGISIAIWQSSVAREQAQMAAEAQRQAEIETEHAKAEEEKAKKITAYVSKVFSYANPHWYAEGAKFKGETKVIEAMDELSDKIDTDFAGQADIQAELHHKFADVFASAASRDKNGVGRNERSKQYTAKALDHARRALALRRQFYGERHELVAKDMVYLYWFNDVKQSERAAYLMEAINMMRETNPNNLNLPYMLADYTNRLMMPDTAEKYHEQYRNAVFPPTDENKYQIGERYLREMLPVFRLHYKEDNYTIFVAECQLAYTLAMQEKWTDFDEHYAVCKQGEEKLKGGNLAEGMRKDVELVEKVLAEKAK